MRSAVLMHRLRVAAVLVLAVVLAAQLTLHNHSLIPEGGAGPALACGVCAFGADRVSPDVPLAAALVLLGLVAACTHVAVAREVSIATAGRAPPRPLR
jgi:hypothetical protein